MMKRVLTLQEPFNGSMDHTLRMSQEARQCHCPSEVAGPVMEDSYQVER